MNRASTTIRIHNPCSENWDAMSSNDQGKFCSQCSKNVTDFTKLSDNEILEIIKESKQRLCGRLNLNQLNRPIYQIEKQRSFSSIYKIAASLLLFSSINKIYAEVQKPTTSIVPTIINDNSSSIYKVINNDIDTSSDSLKTLQGTITDSLLNEFIPYAKLQIQNSKLTVLSDSLGNFKITVADSLLSDTIVLKIESIGYEDKEMLISKLDLPTSVNITMMPIETMLKGEVVMVGGIGIEHIKRKRWWQFWK